MSVPFLTEADVAALVSLTDVIDSLEGLLVREGAGTRNIPKSLATWEPASSAHTLGGLDVDTSMCAFKNWVNTPAGAQAVLSLFDCRTGALLAVMEANHLGGLRTAGVAGVATRWLAPAGARELTVIGSGRQALRQVEAVAAVLALERVRVWSPTLENRVRFAERVGAAVEVDVVVAGSLEEAVHASPVLTLVTRAREPFLSAELLSGTPEVHLNAMGAVLPANAELEADVARAADLVVVDNVENARRLSRELTEGRGPDLEGVRELNQVLREGTGRPVGARLTMFKAMGMGLSDLAAAIVVAKAAGIEGGPS